ncbi:MAG: hypothetical protein HY902_20555 [Deltaproteobacteria bacterium]|nr:hypothetical protein [Deltaproteobacteria bacterium]
MAGQVLGSGFQFVIRSLLGGELLFPDLQARVDAMDGAAWYDWGEYVAATKGIAEVLVEATIVHVGQEIMLTARPLLEQQGFASPEALLGDWRRVFESNVRGLDESQLPVTIAATDGRATVDYGVELPPALVEGYLRGAVLMFGRRVESFTRTVVSSNGHDRLRCTVAWR